MKSTTVVVTNIVQLFSEFVKKNTLTFPMKVIFSPVSGRVIIEETLTEKEYNYTPTLKIIEGNIYKN
jgi:hypothetical protein